MLPKWHVLYGFIFSLLLIYFFNFSLFAGLIVFLASIFIELDHVLIYVLKTKSLNPFNFYPWWIKRRDAGISLSKEEKGKYKYFHLIFHGIELVLILIALSYWSIFFFWVLLGCLLHLILDILELIYRQEHLSCKLSQIWLWQRNKNRKEFIVR